MAMIIGSKVMVVVMVIFGVFLFLCGLMVLLGIRNVDKEDRLIITAAIVISFLIGYSLIIGGIQLWQI